MNTADLKDLNDVDALSAFAAPNKIVKNTNQVTVSGLSPNKTYDVQILVSDEAGNQAVYSPTTVSLDVGFPWLGARAAGHGWHDEATVPTKPLQSEHSRGSVTRFLVVGDFLYYSDDVRIFKVNRSSGDIVGWIGEIGETPPTGGAVGCTTTPPGSYTPGWCVGGVAGSTVTPIAGHLATDNTTLFSANKNWIVKFNLTSGKLQGWIGNIETTPTSGATGCDEASSGTFTPGWCLGGSPDPGPGTTIGETTGDGRPGRVVDLHLRNDGYLYVAAHQMIRRYAVGPGTFNGWIGRVQDPPTSGDADCALAQAGDYTPAWCFGGTASTSGGTLGRFASSIGGLTSDGDYLYIIGDTSVIVRIDSVSGQGQGWVGVGGAIKPTGGGAGCTSLANGAWTPAWCFGGSSSKDFIRPTTSIVYQDNHLYLGSKGKLYKVVADTGANAGWTGFVEETPTGGGAGCLATVKSQHTPGWCTGGTPGWSESSYAFANTQLASTQDGDLYAFSRGRSYYVSSDNNPNLGAIARYKLSTGALTGWLGQAADQTKGWERGGEPTFTFGQSGLSRPTAVTSDATYFYVAQDGRIDRFLRDDGTYKGWTGIVDGVPTGGDPGCTSVAIGDHTPGWCLGGAGSGGEISQMAIGDDALYALMSQDARVSKYDLATGQYLGWIGTLLFSPKPSGGAAGCTTMASDTFTPGWCIGGSSNHSFITHGFYFPHLIAIDRSTTPDTLYVGDINIIGTITRFNAETGAFLGIVGTPGFARDATALAAHAEMLYIGREHDVLKWDVLEDTLVAWIGQIGTQPSGGAAGCSDAGVGDFTPGWCEGGDSASAPTAGQFFDTLIDIHVSNNGYFYVGDKRSRVIKFDLGTGKWLGWQGIVSQSPTGGDAGCAGRPPGLQTPGWCVGGLSESGGLFDSSVTPSWIVKMRGSVFGTPDGGVFALDGPRGRIVRVAP